MTTYRKKFLLTTTLVLVTFACNFISGKLPDTDTSPTETTLPIETSAPPQSLLSPNSTPMSNGLTLSSKSETGQILGGYQATYLEDAADGFSPADQNEIEKYFGSNRNFTIHLNTHEPHLVWATGWCASDQDILAQNLKKIQFEMSVNDQLVDLEQVFVEDIRSITDGRYCHLYRTIVNGLPSGTTTLKSKTIINEPVNDGAKDYPTGELTRTYEVINSAETNQIQNSPILGSKEETQSAIDKQTKTLTSVAEVPPFLNKGTTTYSIDLNNSNEHLTSSRGWCATAENILAQNLEHMRFELKVNEQPIDLKTILSKFFKNSDGLYCFSYSILVYNWPSGTTIITSKIVMEELINDGIENYPVGEITKVYIVTAP
jgi:hypothetical protein